MFTQRTVSINRFTIVGINASFYSGWTIVSIATPGFNTITLRFQMQFVRVLYETHRFIDY